MSPCENNPDMVFIGKLALRHMVESTTQKDGTTIDYAPVTVRR